MKVEKVQGKNKITWEFNKSLQTNKRTSTTYGGEEARERSLNADIISKKVVMEDMSLMI